MILNSIICIDLCIEFHCFCIIACVTSNFWKSTWCGLNIHVDRKILNNLKINLSKNFISKVNIVLLLCISVAITISRMSAE